MSVGVEIFSQGSSTLSLTSALEEVSGQPHAPAALTPGKTRYPLYTYRGLVGRQDQSGGVRKFSPPNEIRSPDRPFRSKTYSD